jgi:uncharacterized protein (DUF1778 family)
MTEFWFYVNTELLISRGRGIENILMQAAEARHTNVSQFVLQASLDAAQAVLVDQAEFRLPPAQWKAFCETSGRPGKK